MVTALINEINIYSKKYSGETNICNRFVDLLKSNETCFFRESIIGHITGSAFIVNKDRDHTLLL